METLLVAAAAVIVGLAVAVFGARLFYLLMPLWGFLTGLVLGADLLASVAGDGLFATLGGWVAGAVMGLLMATLAGLWFDGAVVVLGVGAGVTVASGLLAALGVDGGLVTLAGGVIAGGAVGVAVIAADGPSSFVAALTGYAGATWATVGALMIVGRTGVADLHGVGAAGAMRGDALGLGVAFLLGTLAFGCQTLDLRARGIHALRRDGYRF